MKTKLFLFLAIIGLLLAVAACSQTQAASDGIQKNAQKTVEVAIEEFTQNNHLNKSVEINRGDTLTLILGSNPTTGFKWTEQAQVDIAAVLKQTGHNYIEPASKDGQTVAGAAGKEVWTFKTLKAGSAEISVDYSRPWEGGEKSEWTFKLNVVVK
jgi:inhibitor of cysteine peptidase